MNYPLEIDNVCTNDNLYITVCSNFSFGDQFGAGLCHRVTDYDRWKTAKQPYVVSVSVEQIILVSPVGE